MNVTACNLPDNLLEAYAMGKLTDQESRPVEEHLLLCPVCQKRLEDLDDFLQVVRAALESFPTSQSRCSLFLNLRVCAAAD